MQKKFTTKKEESFFFKCYFPGLNSHMAHIPSSTYICFAFIPFNCPTLTNYANFSKSSKSIHHFPPFSRLSLYEPLRNQNWNLSSRPPLPRDECQKWDFQVNSLLTGIEFPPNWNWIPSPQELNSSPAGLLQWLPSPRLTRGAASGCDPKSVSASVWYVVTPDA